MLVVVGSQKEIDVPSNLAQSGRNATGPYDGTGMTISAFSSAATLSKDSNNLANAATPALGIDKRQKQERAGIDAGIRDQ
jgi:hypothetical protein